LFIILANIFIFGKPVEMVGGIFLLIIFFML